MQTVLNDGKKRMAGAIGALDKEFGKLRTGRATTALVDTIVVDYYGTPTPISQLSSVSVPDSKTITIQPWDKGAFGAVEKAIQTSDLGLNLVKVAKKYTEDAKIAIRNVRRDMNDALKKMEKDKEISEDDLRRGEGEVQKMTDEYVKKADDVVAAKEKEILEI
jgi:ribosome recycling factor